MRVKVIALIIVFFLSLSISYSEITDTSYLLLNFTKDIDLSLDYGHDSTLSYINITSRENPLETSQTKIVKVSSNYNYHFDPSTNTFYFHFPGLDIDSMTIQMRFIIESFKNYPLIRNATYVPVDNEYTKFGRIVDINRNLKRKASELANGADNSFEIAVRIADWINENIEYDLEIFSHGENASATWVFKHKKGVCKEITALFVSMMRSLGIPSRVVIGFSYTNDPRFNERWSGHAWAEVYIDGKWVPFDVTYREYGYVDPSHIPFRKLLFFNESYEDMVELKGSDLSIERFSTNYNVEVLNNKTFKNRRYKIDIDYDDKVDFGSSDYIKVKIKNLENSYIHLFLNIVGPKEITFNNTELSLVLKPLEVKEVYFNYKIDNNLDPKYIYKLPIEIYNREYSKEFVIIASDRYPHYDKVKTFSESGDVFNNGLKISVNCSCIYLNPFEYDCKIRNLNNFEIKNMTFCIGGKCNSEHLLVNEIKEVKVLSPNKELIVKVGNFSRQITCVVPNLSYSYYAKDGIISINYSLNPSSVYGLNFIFNNRSVLLKNNPGKLRLNLNEGANQFKFRVTYGEVTVMEKSFEVTRKVDKKSTSIILFLKSLLLKFFDLFNF